MTVAVRLMLLLASLAFAGVPPAAAGEDAPGRASPAQMSDPCTFYRGQAYGRSLTHFATEMLWACEAIAVRRAAAIDLSDRLLATEAALERYRAAVVAAGSATFARGRGLGGRLGAPDADKSALAESTGTLAALEAIRTGF